MGQFAAGSHRVHRSAAHFARRRTTASRR